MYSSLSQKWLLILGAGVLILAWILPNHYSPWVVAYQEFASFFACLLFVAVMLLVGKVKISPALFIFLLLPSIPLLQQWVGLTYFAGDAWIASLYLVGFAMTLLVGYNLAEQPADRYLFARLLALVFVVGAVLSAWIALRQWLLLSGSIWVADLPPDGRPFANLAQPNNLATLLCMGLSGVLYFYETQQLGRVAAGLLAGFLLFGVVLTQSRTPWVAAIAVTVFWGWKTIVYKPRLTVRGLLGWQGIYVLYVLALPKIGDWLLLSSGDVLRVESSLERWNIWKQSWQAIWHGSWWGYGWNQISVAEIEGALSYQKIVLAGHSHNLLLDLLLWNGPLLGMVIILGIGVWLILLGWRAHSAEGLFALLAAGFMLVHSMLEFPLEYAFFLFPLGLLLGVVAAEQRDGLEVEIPRWLLGIVLIIFIGLFGWIWREYRLIEEDFRLMRFELARVGTLKATQSAPDVILLSQLREYIHFVRTPAKLNMSVSELDRMRKVIYRYPNFSGFIRYATALGINGQPDAAREQMLIFRKLYGEKYYIQAVAEMQAMKEQYPQLSGVFND